MTILTSQGGSKDHKNIRIPPFCSYGLLGALLKHFPCPLGRSSASPTVFIPQSDKASQKSPYFTTCPTSPPRLPAAKPHCFHASAQDVPGFVVAGAVWDVVVAATVVVIVAEVPGLRGGRCPRSLSSGSHSSFVGRSRISSVSGALASPNAHVKSRQPKT